MSQRLEKPQQFTHEVSPQNGYSSNGLNGHSEEGFSHTVSLTPDASRFSANGNDKKVLPDMHRDVVLCVRDSYSAGERVDRISVASKLSGRYHTLGGAAVGRVLHTANHFLKFDESLRAEMGVEGIGHGEGQYFPIFPEEEAVEK